MTKKKPENLSFEEALTELESIVSDLEKGDLPLEESMKLFERGLTLSGTSQEKLSAAEQKIQILMNASGTGELKDFDLPESSNS